MSCSRTSRFRRRRPPAEFTPGRTRLPSGASVRRAGFTRTRAIRRFSGVVSFMWFLVARAAGIMRRDASKTRARRVLFPLRLLNRAPGPTIARSRWSEDERGLGPAAKVACGGRVPCALLGVFGPGGLRQGAGADLLRPQLELRGARSGNPAPGGLQAHVHRREAGGRRPRSRRRPERVREPLRAPRRAVLPAASRQRARVHVSLPSVDVRPPGQPDRRAVPARPEEARRHARGFRSEGPWAAQA